VNLPPARSRALPGLLLVAVAAGASLALAPAITSLTGVVASPLVVALVAGEAPNVRYAGVACRPSGEVRERDVDLRRRR